MDVATLTRNDICQLKAVSYGSVKVAQAAGKSNEQILLGSKIAAAPTADAIKAFVANLSAAERAALLGIANSEVA